MPSRDIEALSLSADRVSSRIEFLMGYGNYCISEYDEQRRPAREDVRLLDNGESGWYIQADAASSFVEAAQLTSLTDPAAARQIYLRAGAIYERLGHPYGYFLQAIAGKPLGSDMAERGLANMEAIDQNEAVSVPRPWHAPQQQLYFLLAASTLPPNNFDELRDRLKRSAQQSPYRSGTAPVGALGTAVHRLWTVATELLDADPENHYRVAEVVSAHVRSMAAVYTERVALAQVNGYTWSHLASPIDVVDVEILGVCALAFQLVPKQIMRQHLDQALIGMPTLSGASVNAAEGVADSVVGRRLQSHDDDFHI